MEKAEPIRSHTQSQPKGGLSLEAYQAAAHLYASRSPLRLMYSIIGLSAQAGSIASQHRHAYRIHGGVTNVDVQKIAVTLGDALWYIADIASALNLELDQIAGMNLDRIEGLVESGLGR